MMRTPFVEAIVGMAFLSVVSAAAADSTAAAALDVGSARGVQPALNAGTFGLFPPADFRLVKGECADCGTIEQARWYFRDDLIAVPKPGLNVSGFSRRIAPQVDVNRWFQNASAEDLKALAPLVWIGSPSIAFDATLLPTGDQVRLADGTILRFRLTPKIASNRSYYDAKTAAFFQQRRIRIRGKTEQDADAMPALVARTIWPQDYVIDQARLKLLPLRGSETLSQLVRREPNAERERYEVRLLWERSPGKPREWADLAVLGLLLNGAQGDDDEAHGGHFAVVTGRYAQNGEWADWMVNNFYNLDYFSEKGIVASMLPMDNYLLDLNSGQSYYRPSYMLVAILRNDHAAYAYQGAIQRVYNRFYRHDFSYRHAGANCGGISVDTLRSLGWNIPARGSTSYLKALASYPYMAIREMSLESGRKSYEYLSEEQTRLYPAVTFDAAGRDLLQLVGAVPGSGRKASAFEQELQRDVEAILFVRIPQIPSSRAFGLYPVASIDEYMSRVPEDKSQWKIVPVDPRPFPNEFIDDDTLNDARNPGWPVVAGIVVLIVGVLYVRLLRRQRARTAQVDPLDRGGSADR